MDTHQLLEQIKGLLQEEREHTKNMVREEVQNEAEHTREKMTFDRLDVSSQLTNIANRVKNIEIDQKNLKQGQAPLCGLYIGIRTRADQLWHRQM